MGVINSGFETDAGPGVARRRLPSRPGDQYRCAGKVNPSTHLRNVTTLLAPLDHYAT